MARLTAAKRNALPTRDFAGPDRSYPIEDKAHARDAKARASANAAPKLRAQVDAKADRKLGKPAPGEAAPRHPRSHAEFEALGKD